MKSKEESFNEIMTDIKVVGVYNLTFFMKYNPKTKLDEFLADFNSEDDTMYFSVRRVWGIFRDEYGMNDKEIKEFLHESISARFGLNVKPY
jgi:hypothetical protein